MTPKLRPLAMTAAALITVTALSGCSGAAKATSAPSPSSALVAPISTAEPTPVDTTTDSPPPVPPPVAASVSLDCDEDDSPAGEIEVDVPPTGYPDFTDAWAHALDLCTAVRTNDPPTPLEIAVTKAAEPSGDTLEEIYESCAETDPTDDVFSEAKFVPSDAQVPEIAATLLLCPNRPRAAAWRKSLARGEALVKLTKAGRTFGDGVHLVGKEIKAGTYVVTGDISDCYWERQNRNGGIIANDFIDAARRVQVTIRSSDYAFSSDGCGDWAPA
jgi:hypothetical protein